MYTKYDQNYVRQRVGSVSFSEDFACILIPSTLG